jgi:serine protease AprX
MQQFHLRETNTLPAVNELVTWLRAGGVVINDGDDENDNVINTGLDFIRVDALTALDAVKRHLRKRLFYELMLLVK